MPPLQMSEFAGIRLSSDIVFRLPVKAQQISVPWNFAKLLALKCAYVDHSENYMRQRINYYYKIDFFFLYSVQYAFIHLGCAVETFTHFLKVCKEIQNVILLLTAKWKSEAKAFYLSFQLNPSGLLLPCLAVIYRYANGSEKTLPFSSALHTRKSGNACVFRRFQQFCCSAAFMF